MPIGERNSRANLRGDSNRGVIDSTHIGSVDVGYELGKAASVTLGFQRSQRSSNATSRDFFNTNMSLGLQYRF